MENLKGVGVALVTPFDGAGEIDYSAFGQLIDHTINGNVDFLVVQGTTGESATLSLQKKQEVLTFSVKHINSRLPLVYGHGGNNTQVLIESYKSLELAGVSAILSVSPYYNKPSQQGIIAHFSALNEAFDLPIILYNVPGRTGSNMLASTTLKLAELNNIIGVKEASGDLSQMSQIIKYRPSSFKVWSGDDDLILHQMGLGADGVISVIANALPVEFSDLVHSVVNGDFKTARKRHYQLCDIIPLLFEEGNPGGIKAVLKMIGIGEENMLMPLLPVSNDLRLRLKSALDAANIKTN
ncbi:MAG: 4-hydroxy-tetrahydrodipicolinate synthase [Salibacteraceae bacterium]|jgi:4-hydroxy-tetrahydrodipicolinate synthase